MNKPTKQTISDLRAALEAVEWRLKNADAYAERETLYTAQTGIKRALAQLTQDDALPCGAPGCNVTKPTKRALAAHQAHCLYSLRASRALGYKTVMKEEQK